MIYRVGSRLILTFNYTPLSSDPSEYLEELDDMCQFLHRTIQLRGR